MVAHPATLPPEVTLCSRQDVRIQWLILSILCLQSYTMLHFVSNPHHAPFCVSNPTPCSILCLKSPCSILCLKSFTVFHVMFSIPHHAPGSRRGGEGGARGGRGDKGASPQSVPCGPRGYPGCSLRSLGNHPRRTVSSTSLWNPSVDTASVIKVGE